MDFHPFDSSEFSLQLYGTSQVKFTQLKDNPQWSNENLNKTFIGGKWTFFHDKAFNFTPSPAANVRQDLYPIQGTYSKSSDEIYGFQGECKSSVGTSASIDGIIRIDGEEIIVDAIYTVVAMNVHKIVRICQTLSTDTSPVSNIIEVQGIQVPAIFNIYLSGSTETKSFNSVSGKLKILPTSEEDSNPFLIIISVDKNNNPDNVDGEIFWQSYNGATLQADEVISHIKVEKNQVQMEISNSQAPRVDFTWYDRPYPSSEKFKLTGVSAQTGSMTFVIQDTQITGEIQASGISDNASSSTYQGKFTGEQIVSNNGEQVQGIPVNTAFRIFIQGQVDSFSFDSLPHKLEIYPAPPGNENPFIVALFMEINSVEELTNGSIFWQSYTPNHTFAQEHNSTITVIDNQVRINLNFSEVFRSDVMWHALRPSFELFDELSDMPISVTGTEGKLTFSIQDEHIYGEIKASGAIDICLYPEGCLPNTYYANFTGNKII